MSKKYLVTGGSGFIGRSTVASLVKSGFGVRVLDDGSRGNKDSLDVLRKDIEFIRADIRDPQKVSRACKGVDAVIHLASVNGTEFFYSMPEVVLDVSTRGMLNVIDACLQNGVGELFFASSSEVYQTPKVLPTGENVEMVIPDPMNARYSYAGGKIISELLLINYGRKYFDRAIIFRPHNVYGPEMGMEHVIPQFILRMKKLANNKSRLIKFPIQGTGKETRTFVYIDDFTSGLMTLIESGEHLQIYNIGTSEEVQIAKVAEMVASFFKKKIILVPGKLQEGSTLRRLPDISKIKKLGYIPKITLAQGILKTARWYNANLDPLPSIDSI